MDEQRKAQDPTLVCTCNDLYITDIQQALAEGETAYKDIFAVHDMAPRCCGCVDDVQQLVVQWQQVATDLT